MNSKGRIVIKLGGGLITNKNLSKTINKEAIKNICNTLKQLNDEGYVLIIVHGAGSYGHILSKKMDIANGINKEIQEQQINAVKQIRSNMIELNNEVIKSLKKIGLLAIGHPPSKWAKGIGKDFTGNLEIFETINNDKIPICFGDVVDRDDRNKFGILSGDDLMYRISMEIPNVNFTIFLLGDVDGVLTNPPNNVNAKLIKNYSKNDIPNTFHNSDIDVTGGIDLKLLRAVEISNKIENVWFLNGNRSERIMQLIHTGTTIGTKILP